MLTLSLLRLYLDFLHISRLLSYHQIVPRTLRILGTILRINFSLLSVDTRLVATSYRRLSLYINFCLNWLLFCLAGLDNPIHFRRDALVSRFNTSDYLIYAFTNSINLGLISDYRGSQHIVWILYYA